MKKKQRIILSSLVVLFILAVALPAKAGVSLFINEHPIEGELPIIEGRTMVPIRILEDHFGAEVEVENYDSKRLLADKLKLNFKLGEQIVKTNVGDIFLTTPPQRISDEFFIPLRVVENVYGGDLEWRGVERTINYTSRQLTDIYLDDNGKEEKIIIGADLLDQYKVDFYSDPNRIVVDLSKTYSGKVNNSIPIGGEIVDRVRVSQFEIDPAVTRVVIDLNRFANYDVREEDNNLIIEVEADLKTATSAIINRLRSQVDRFNKKEEPKRIVIDPGHGGWDPGAVGYSGVEEKEVVLQMGKKLKDLLVQRGYDVLLTRNRDVFVPLYERARLANKWSADLFISIHANFNYNPRIDGTATYAHWNSRQKTWALAWYVQDEMVSRIKRRDNGLKAANFVVLRQTNMPAILVETAFLSNPKEERLLVKESFQLKTVRGIAAGIDKYFANQN